MAECFVCKKLCFSYNAFFQHIKRHYVSELSYYTCITCDNKKFLSLNTFRRHMKNTHFKLATTDDQLECQNQNIIDCDRSNDMCESAEEIIVGNFSEATVSNITESFSNNASNRKIEDDIFKNLKDSALKFVLSLFSKNNINRSDAFDIIGFVKDFILHEIVNSIKSIVLPFVDVKNKIELLNLLFNVTNLFRDTDTEFKLLSKLKSMNLLFPVEEVTFSNEIQPTHHLGEVCLNSQINKGIIMPLNFYIKTFFDSSNLIEKSLNEIDDLLSKNSLDNFVQGSLWKKKVEMLPKGTKTIPFFLYSDDLQINNALGSHTSSVCAFYISFPTIPNAYKIENILLAALIETSDFKTYGNSVCLQDLIRIIINLENEGINFNIKGEVVNVKFILALVLGDNLALNTILELNKSFNAHYYCRFCKTKRIDAEKQCVELEENLRTKENYVVDISKNDPQNTGLKCETILNQIPSFHFIDNHVVDIMHDLFEGVFIYDICKSILLLIEKNQSTNLPDNKKFSLFTLNLRKRNFNYGSLEIGNICPDITLQRLQTNNLNMSARECWTFIHFFPLMFHDIVNNDDEVWQFICVVVRLLDLILFVSHDDITINLLQNTIKEHNTMFINIFGETLKPKHHFLTHYPRVIKSSGPVRHMSNFMFEAKHKELKTYANVTNNRQFFVLSASIKFQLKFAYKIYFNKNSCEKICYDEKNKIKTSFNENISKFASLENNDFINLSAISYKGTLYKTGLFLNKFNSESQIENFEIKEILYEKSNGNIFIICEKQHRLLYKKEIVGYFLEKYLQTSICIYSIDEFLGFPLNIIHLSNGKKALRLKSFKLTQNNSS